MIPRFPAYVRYGGEPDITTVLDAEHWRMEADFHLDGYEECDRLIDASGRVFRLTGGSGFDPDRIVGFDGPHEVVTLGAVRSDLIAACLEIRDATLVTRSIHAAGSIEAAIRIALAANI